MKRIKILGRKKPAKDDHAAIIEATNAAASAIPVNGDTLIAELKKRIDLRNVDSAMNGSGDAQQSQDASGQSSIPSSPPPLAQSVPLTPPTPPQQSAQCEKESITSSEISSIFDIKPPDPVVEDDSGIEYGLISGNILSPKETARYKITMESNKDISGFIYTIHAEHNFLFTTHIESISRNVVNIIMNNISNKEITFKISYIALL
jgi:hypothetical protein